MPPSPTLPRIGSPKPWRSFRMQTALIAGGLAALLCAVLAFALGQMMARELRADTALALDAIAQTAAQTLAAGLGERLRETQVLAGSAELWAGGLGAPAVSQALARSRAAHPYSAWIGVAALDGKVVASTGNLLLGQSVAQRPWFGFGLKGVHVGDVHRAELLARLMPPSHSGEPLRFVDFAAPIVVDGRTVGVLAMHGTWEWAGDVVASLLPADAAARSLELFIFDKQGRALYASKDAAAAGALLPTANGDASRVATWADGREYLTSVVRVPARQAAADLGWRVVAREPVEQAFARAHARSREAFGIGLIGVLVAGCAAWIASGFVSRPLAAIAQAARDVERGVPEARIPSLTGNDELAQLSSALTGMTNRLHATIQTAPVGICQVDSDGLVLTANRRLCEILGRRGDEVIGRALLDFVLMPDRPIAAEALQRLRSAGAGTVFDELRFLRTHAGDDGETAVSATLSASLVQQAGGERPYFIGVVEDITRRKEGEAAERANAAKTAFLSQVSHELRTPLNAVLGFCQLLHMDASDPLSDRQAARVKTISGAGTHLLAMINDLLDLSQIDSGRLSMSTEPVALPALVEQCIALVSESARGAAIRLDIAPSGAVAANCVRADHVRLRQVLVNLLSNAIKYNRPGGTVSVAWSLAPQPGSVELKVSDTGRGMGPEKLAHLFEPFNRLGAEASPIQGTGIGLVITRQLVEMMGGSLQVASTPEVGTSFSVTLPIGTPADSRVTLRSSDFGSLPVSSSERQTVLYVEDNELNIQLVTAALRMRPNCHLVVARSGREALDIAPGVMPDLFLLDMHLGDMTGLELARRIESLPQFTQTPLIALSADATPAAIRTALDAGFRDYLTKPLDLRKLSGCLATI